MEFCNFREIACIRGYLATGRSSLLVQGNHWSCLLVYVIIISNHSLACIWDSVTNGRNSLLIQGNHLSNFSVHAIIIKNHSCRQFYLLRERWDIDWFAKTYYWGLWKMWPSHPKIITTRANARWWCGNKTMKCFILFFFSTMNRLLGSAF